MREALTAGVSTASDRDSPSRSVTRLLDRKVLTGVTWGDGVGSTEKRDTGRVSKNVRNHCLMRLFCYFYCFLTDEPVCRCRIFRNTPWVPHVMQRDVMQTLTVVKVEQRHFFLLFFVLFLDRFGRRLRFCCLDGHERKLNGYCSNEWSLNIEVFVPTERD